ncbi:MAG: methionine--tRNA ligase [Kiritimatiellaceae bacterium]|nr:methionine--tRNA ligase [Kiritimatiellaceae bacterium]
MAEKTYYVTTPIYYVNDKPHIGHAYTTILADVMASYHRLLGVPTYFLTGTDEHGQKVQQAAEKNGLTPQQQCDQTVVRFQELWKRLNMSNDDFIRTTEERHKVIVQEVLQDLFDRDEIYRAEYQGWYDVSSETFVSDKDLEALVEASPFDRPEDMPNLSRISEVNYFFRMSKYQDWLIDYIETHPDFIQPDFRANETLGFLKTKKLQDLCISRPKSRLAWGIDLPFDPNFVTYVWFDALLNYITAIGYKRDDAKFNQWWPATHQLIGKDILTTHTVYWPTMLKAMGVALPKTVFAHGWWLTGRTKMSKSLGNVVNPMDMVDRYGVDAFRYFLSAEMTLGGDAAFTEDAFVRRYNSDLANDLGNLLSRTVNMLGRYCGGTYPVLGSNTLSGAPEQDLWGAVQAAVTEMESSIDTMRLNGGISAVMTAVRKVNQYFEIKQPWTQAKEGKTEEVGITLALAAESLRVCAALLYPVMPEKMSALREAFGLGKPALSQLRNFGLIQAGTPIKNPGILFPRIEVEAVEAPVAAPQPKKEKRAESVAAEPISAVEAPKVEGVITYDEVMNVKLRTARVLSAEKVPGADKLLKLQIEVGAEQRQLIAGIALHYTPEQVVGKTIVIVANLKPAKIRGIESQGMLLCASEGECLRLITTDGSLSSSGAVVK